MYILVSPLFAYILTVLYAAISSDLGVEYESGYLLIKEYCIILAATLAGLIFLPKIFPKKNSKKDYTF